MRERKKSIHGGGIHAGTSLKGVFRRKSVSFPDEGRRSVTVNASQLQLPDRDRTSNRSNISTSGTSLNINGRENLLDGSATSRGNTNWDLKSCIDTIESLLHDHDNQRSLSEEQKAAIENLRSAHSSSVSHGKRKSLVKFGNVFAGTGFMKRFASGHSQKLSIPRQKSIYMTEEMRKTWIEVAEDQEDKVRQQCVHDVLEVYGGRRLDPAWGSKGEVPKTLRRIHRKKQERRSAVAQQDISDISNILSTYKSESMQALAAATSMIAISTTHNYCPPEWNRLTPDAKAELTDLLSLENIATWEFDVFKLAELTQNTLKPATNGCCDDDEEVVEEESSPSCKKVVEEQCCPLLFVGWAILCAPKAQISMEGSLEGYLARDPDAPASRRSSLDESERCEFFYHNFCEELKIDPELVCNFLREIERRYVSDVPYHNNVHAADVTQTLHALFALIGRDILYSISTPLELFSLIMAATFHDVGHPGTNNLFQKNAMTPFAIQYNDVSILENMHASVGHSLLMGEDLMDEWDVFERWDQRDIVEARGIMIRAILGTDMSHHFVKMDELLEKIESVRFTANVVLQSELGDSAEVGSTSFRRSRDEKDQQQMLEILGNLSDSARMRSSNGVKEPSQILRILAKVQDETYNSVGTNNKTYAELKTECKELSSNILIFLLHAADISNPAKPKKLAVRWAHTALKEFFAQGDEEKALMLPVSPLCDEETTKTADSQIGFLQFVVQPMYTMLGDVVPRVKKDVLPIMDQNLKYWQKEKARSSILRKEQQEE